MIKSMTGYGRGEVSSNGRVASIEIKSVNHRYCEVGVRISGRYQFAEDAVRHLVKQRANRGKVDVSVNFTSNDEADAAISVNMAIVKQYYQGLRELQKSFDTTGDITIDLLSSMPEVFKKERLQVDEESILALILEATEVALCDFNKMRSAEGAGLCVDLEKKLDSIDEIIKEITKRAPEVRETYASRIKDRVSSFLESPNEAMLEQRLALEIAVFADKSSIDEELVRLSSHIEQFRNAIQNGESDDPVGKKLDFIVQEMNREANTIGSKANDLNITELMIGLKNEIENIREQIQNIC